MLNLTFGEQVKIVLNRKGMTIKELAEIIEEQTGKKMSRQNLTQRLGRDNFQEQDMRMIAEILGCTLQLTILASEADKAAALHTVITDKELEIAKHKRKQSKTIFLKPHENMPKEDAKLPEGERDITIGELVDIHEELDALESNGFMPSEYVGGESEHIKEAEEMQEEQTEIPMKTRKIEVIDSVESVPQKEVPEQTVNYSMNQEVRQNVESLNQMREEVNVKKEINPYTGKEYETNSVRIHPARIGYVQVYDRSESKWTDMTEWAFLGYQERKKALLGSEYEPPIYLD